MELIQMLTSQLGISGDQAQGGAGLLFKMAKNALSGEDFGRLGEAVPGIDGFISSAPEEGGLGSALGGLASALGAKGDKLGNLASLAGGFKSLNLDSNMIGKFIPVVLSFVQAKGGDTIKNILQKALK